MSEWLGPACALMSSVTWAMGCTTYSRLSKEYSGPAINFARAWIALPIFLVTVFIFSGGWSASLVEFAKVEKSHLLWLSLSMVASYGFGDICYFRATRALGIPGALAIASIYPLWTVLTGVLFFGDQVSLAQALGLLLLLAGVVTVVLAADSRATPEAPPAIANKDSLTTGVAFAFGASVFWAINSLAVSRAGIGISPAVGNSIRMVFALMITSSLGRMLPLKAGAGKRVPLSELKKSGWVFCAEAYGGSLFYLYGLSHSPLVIGSTLASLAPVLSVPVAIAAGAEKVSLKRVVGVLFVVVGVILLVAQL